MLFKLRGSFRYIVGIFIGIVVSNITTVFHRYADSNVLRSFGLYKHGYSDKTRTIQLFNTTKFPNKTSPLQLDRLLTGNNATWPRVLVMVITAPRNKHKAEAVRDTWARHGDVLYMSSAADPSLPTVELHIPRDSRRHLTAKTMQGFMHMHTHHRGEYDWFMKADDNTYVIMENLRYFLSTRDPRDPVYLGHLLDAHVSQGYNSGGAGYVLSKTALERLCTEGRTVCSQDGGDEDVEMGHCMQRLGVRTGNTTDRLGRSRFHCLWPEKHMGLSPAVNTDGWYTQMDANGMGLGPPDRLSDLPISFHYMTPQMMVAMEYYVYRLRPHDLRDLDPQLNADHVNKLLSRNLTSTS